MSRLHQTIRAYTELARISNIPTCISNVLVGCAIAGLGYSPNWQTITLTTIAIALLYIAGMALNDAVDHKIDKQQRPSRPIPSGRITLTAAYTFAFLCFALALAILASVTIPALICGLILATTIILYDYIHKHIAASALLMGACRGLVYITAAAAITWPLDWQTIAILAGAITIYITIVTIIAQNETESETAKSFGLRKWLAIALPVVAFAPALAIQPNFWPMSAIAATFLICWLILALRNTITTPPRMKNAILGWLSGICLLDAFYLALLDQPILALVAMACFGLTAIGHRYILGT